MNKFDIILRLIVWPIHCWHFWLSSLYLIFSHYDYHAFDAIILNFLPFNITMPCHSVFVVSFFLVANTLLTILQFYWGVTIFGFLFKKPKPADSKKKL